MVMAAAEVVVVVMVVVDRVIVMLVTANIEKVAVIEGDVGGHVVVYEEVV